MGRPLRFQDRLIRQDHFRLQEGPGNRGSIEIFPIRHKERGGGVVQRSQGGGAEGDLQGGRIER